MRRTSIFLRLYLTLILAILSKTCLPRKPGYLLLDKKTAEVLNDT